MTSSKDMLKSMDMNSYWDKVSLACAADDYVRSKQQQDNRSEACLIVYNARKLLALNKGKLVQQIGSVVIDFKAYLVKILSFFIGQCVSRCKLTPKDLVDQSYLVRNVNHTNQLLAGMTTNI